MGVTKTEGFTEEQLQISNLAKAIGHPARVAILEYIVKSKSCICSDIVNELPLAQATISQHLKELKLAGIIKGSIEGNTICYCIDESKLAILASFLGGCLAVEKSSLPNNNCC
jgi:predicted transcriptional regulator